ncbi:MAG: DUF4190 domain-containing protein, partial [Lacisediminihabitans sp.]
RSGEKGHGFALAGTIIGYVAFVLTVILIVAIVVGVTLGASRLQSEVRGLSHSQSSAQPEKSDGSQSSATGTYSDEFCHDLFVVVQSARTAMKDPSQSDSVREAYAALAAVSSPHQESYQSMADILTNPTGVKADQIKTATSEFTKAAQSDILACAGRLK